MNKPKRKVPPRKPSPVTTTMYGVVAWDGEKWTPLMNVGAYRPAVAVLARDIYGGRGAVVHLAVTYTPPARKGAK